MPGDFVSTLFWDACDESLDDASIQAWGMYTGQTEEAMQDWGWLEAVHPADQAALRKALVQVSRNPTVRSLFYQIRYLDGTYVRFRALHTPLFTDDHQFRTWFIFLRRISDSFSPSDEQQQGSLIQHTPFNQTDAGLVTLSLDGKIVRVNECFCQLLGYAESELIALSIWQLSPPEEAAIQLQAMSVRLVSGENPLIFSTCFLHKDGTTVWVKLTEFCLSEASGSPSCFFIIVENITRQAQAEAEYTHLLASVQEAHAEAETRARQLEAVFESINDGIMVCDQAGQIVRMNSAVCQILHMDESEPFWSIPFPERMTALRAFHENGQPFTPEDWPLGRLLRGMDLRDAWERDIRELLPDGSEIYVNYTGSALRDSNGVIVGAVLVIHDVTERRCLEQRVRKSFDVLLTLAEDLVHIPGRWSEDPSEAQDPPLSQPAVAEYLTELLCPLLEYQSMAISLIDSETMLLTPIALTGLDEQEKYWQTKRFSSFAFTDYLDPASIERLHANEVILWDLTPYNPGHQPYVLLAAPMLLDNHLKGILSVRKRDAPREYTPEEISLVKAVAKLILLVLERERLQREWIDAHSSELALREANRRFDEFLGIASHELRTPLAGIKGNIQLALRRLNKLKSTQMPALHDFLVRIDDVEEYLRHAEHRVNVQNRMISDLLDVSRIQANKLELVTATCDLMVIVSEAIEDQRYNAPGRLITLAQPSSTQLLVNGDADRIGQVIHNYLTNALKYSPADQPIAVSMELLPEERVARVAVKDYGPGLTLEEQDRVWERFYRVKGVAAQEGLGPGLGLGLHISRTIIDAHYGNLGLDSAPGLGSTFWFTLPLVEVVPGPPEEPVPVEEAAPLQEHASELL